MRTIHSDGMTKQTNGEAEARGRLKMADIARLAGVSTSTVSRALADSPLIPAALREEIVNLAQAHGYVVNQSARSLRLRKTHTINIVIPLGHEGSQLISDPFFLEMIGRLADEITARNYEVLLTKVGDPKPGWLERIIQAHRSDGLIVIGQSNQHDALNKAAEHYRPLVVWGGHLPGQVYCSVGSDNVGGARMAVEHLIRRGRRRIAFLGDPSTPEVSLRRQGYLDALADAGLEAPPELSAPAYFTVETAYTAARALIDSGAQFDALFAASDLSAITAIQALAAAGRRTPEDVSVVGFDDIALAQHSSPPLTTVRQPLDLGARRLVELLFRRIAGEEAHSVTLPPKLIVRES
jgi:DNA-binding LacI/PurR family transcriptional regulator